MLEFKELLQLMKVAAKASTSAPTSYSFNGQNLSGEAINETLREELKELCGTNALYRENKNTIFSLIEQTLDEVLPRKITEDYMQFAEVKVFGQGDKPIFRRKLNCLCHSCHSCHIFGCRAFSAFLSAAVNKI